MSSTDSVENTELLSDPIQKTWLHVHVPKAGGSTLRQLMRRNFGKGFYNSESLLETKQYSCEEVSEIVRCHPHVKCLSDHKLSFDLPFQHEHASVYALSYVRDPVERFISRYFFHRYFEEVSCIAQRMSFREFANAELIEQEVHPQTNSQIYFLNGGHSFDDMTVIHQALETEKAFLFPIERFDESCICLERLFPTAFSDLSYVRANVSKKDAVITDEDRELAMRYLKIDYPVIDLSHKFLDTLLAKAFHSDDDRESSLAEFKDRCSRRYHNFYPPVEKGEPVPPIGSEPPPKKKKPVVMPDVSSNPKPEIKPYVEPDDPSSETKEAVEPKETQPTKEPIPEIKPKPTIPTDEPE